MTDPQTQRLERRPDHERCVRLLSDLECSLRSFSRQRGDLSQELRQRCETASGVLRSRLERPDKRLYRELPRAKPRLARRVETLRSGYDRLVEGLDAVVRHVDLLCAGETAKASDVGAQVRLLIDDLHRHELEEVRLLQSAYWREVGVGD